jgi:hypothetical protein
MREKLKRPRRQPETEFIGERQLFSGPALAPDDSTLEPRVRKGRPTDKQLATPPKKRPRKTD